MATCIAGHHPLALLAWVPRRYLELCGLVLSVSMVIGARRITLK